MGSVTRVRAQFDQLCHCLSMAKRTDMVKLDENEHRFALSEVSAIDEVVEFVKNQFVVQFPCFAPYIDSKPVFTTPQGGVIGYLSHIFGRKRFERIAQRSGVDLTHRMSNNLSIREIELLLINAVEVYENDLQELLEQIKSNSEIVGFLNEEESRSLRAQFRDVHVLDDCSNDHFEALFSLLTPFKSISNLFSRTLPGMVVDVAFTGISSALLKTRVDIYEKMELEPLAYEKWMMLMAKKLIYYELPEKVVFRNGYGGFCTVHAKVAEAGACKFFLKQLGQSQKEHNNTVAYRGTSLDVHTFVEDFRAEFGSQGPKATYEKTLELVSDPVKGFVKTKEEKLDAIGTSLGGCQVMRDAILLKQKYAKIVSLVGPGLDKISAQLYAKRVNADEEGTPAIEHWWEADDVAQYFGSAHLGFECEPQKAHITINILEKDNQENTEESIQDIVGRIVTAVQFPYGANRAESWVNGTAVMLKALEGPHRRNTLEQPHRVHRITNREHPELVNKLLSHKPEVCDPGWEEMRRWFYIEQFPFVSKTDFAKYATEITK